VGIKTTMSGLTYPQSHVAAATKSAQNVSSLHNEIMLSIAELVINLNILLATMQPGDPNIATLQAQITALS
jgi:hypothetical protein